MTHQSRSEITVPVIDIAPFAEGGDAGRRTVAEAVDSACRDIGFLVVAGHGVSDELVERTFSAMRAFFALPEAEKLKIRQPEAGVQRGYVPARAQALSYTLGNASPPDLFERFRIGRPDVPDDDYHHALRDKYFQPNLWPDGVPELRAAVCDYYRTMEGLAARLMRIFAVALGLPENFFDDAIDRHITAFSVNHYPVPEGPPEPGQMRAGAHTDYGSLTILKSHAAPGGLQVRGPDGAWRDVVPEPGTFIVNIGDLMARWTNDRWVSTLHRVVPPPVGSGTESDRMSLVFFHQPNADARVECLPSCRAPGETPKYPPTTSGEHLLSKVARQRAPAAAE